METESLGKDSLFFILETATPFWFDPFPHNRFANVHSVIRNIPSLLMYPAQRLAKNQGKLRMKATYLIKEPLWYNKIYEPITWFYFLKRPNYPNLVSKMLKFFPPKFLNICKEELRSEKNINLKTWFMFIIGILVITVDEFIIIQSV